jgi:RNA polymerase sigma factor (sigma-70 family)
VVWDSTVERRAQHLFEEFRVHERPETFRALFEVAGPALLPLIRMKVRRQGRHVDPAELLTDTFAQVYRARHTFEDRGDGSFARWFLAIAENLLRSQTREAARRTRREQLVARRVEDRDSDPVAQVLADEARRVARLTYGELRALVLEGLARLRPSHEQALLLHVHEKLTYGQIAGRLGISRGAEPMRIQRARANILAHVRRRLDAAVREAKR